MFVIAAALTLMAPVPQAATPPQRIRNVQLQAGQSCPPSSDGEIVVCAPPIAEPYRLPQELRDQPRTDLPSAAWSVRAERALDDQQRLLPDSCSPIGTAGQSGCFKQSAERWAAERRAQSRGEPLTPDN